jgi:hypothetical protein
MKVSHHNNRVVGGGIVGVTVEWVLNFGIPTAAFPTDKEKELIDKSYVE